jgi:type 1 fimbria pilin
MKWSISSLLMSVAVIGMLCIPRIAAAYEGAIASGRITFIGAIVEPTCGVTAESAITLIARAAAQNAPQQIACTGPNATVAAPQIFAVNVVHLTDAEPDRVLKYFNDYVKASQAGTQSPVLVTQTYE